MEQKKTYYKPFLAMERFVSQEFISACTQSAHGSPDGQFVYGWVLKCESVSWNGSTIGHGHGNCPDEGYFEKQDSSGLVDGTFIRAKDQTQSTNFNLSNVDAGYVNWIDYDGSGDINPGDWWIIDDHAFKVQGSYNVVSYPVSARYDVNLS